MIAKQLLEIIKLILKEKYVRTISLFIMLFAIFIAIILSPLSAFIIYCSYISGYIISWFLMKYRTKTGIVFQRLSSFYRGKFSSRKVVKHSCSICDNLSCRRHQTNATVTPWKHLHISKELNTAVENFYERIMDNFISSWYSNLTDDTDFINELRYCFRYAVASVVNRILDLDVADIIANKLVPCAVKHVDDFLYMQQIGKLKNVRFNEIVIEYMGKRLHIAATNRKSELTYLQHLVSALLVNILPDKYMKCRNHSVIMREILAGWVFLPLMDVLADPNIINSLVILAVTYKSKKISKVTKNEEMVEFLHNYAVVDTKTSAFATNLNKIKNSTELLYAFMQFLKKQDNVNLLQFCLDVDDFNSKLLTPNLSKKQIEELHSDVRKLYKEYIDKSSFNFIGCPSSISNDFERMLNDSYAVDKLSKLSKLLYKAYDHTFTALESTWLPQFFHSNEFYAHICGSKIVATYNKQGAKSKRYDSPSQGTVSKLSSGIGKIKGVLKTTQTVEGAFYSIEPQNVENGTVDEILLSECKTLFRDLSTWNVTVPSYQASPSNKVIYFYVNVERSDILSETSKKSWVVLRKDQDFYTLKSKLVEFHGDSEISDSPLPSRKAASSIENRMAKYQEFLKRLLAKPTLRGSDLLYSFLTTEEDFTMFIATNASNIQDIGNIYQSVAYKLRKEKGQHLDPFISTFLSSTGAGKASKLEFAEEGEEIDKTAVKCSENIPPPKTYRNHIFNDNFGVQHKNLKETMSGSFNPESFCECIFYLLKHIFKVPNGLLRLYAAVCSVTPSLVDLTSRIIIEKKLKSGLCQSNLAYLIRQLETVIFTSHISPTKEELEKRRMRAFEELRKVVPSYVKKMLSCDIDNGFRVLLEILQHPHYNKQLAYNLVDIVLTEMYPILEKNEDYY